MREVFHGHRHDDAMPLRGKLGQLGEGITPRLPHHRAAKVTVPASLRPLDKALRRCVQLLSQTETEVAHDSTGSECRDNCCR
jgi:hypothetical protein